MKKNLLLSVIVSGALLLGACAPSATSTTAAAGSSASGGEKQVVKLGVIGSKHEVWDKVKENLAKENIEIQFVEFTEYTTPNEALAAGDIDLNSFQHHIFFDNFNKNNGDKLVAIADTFLSPIGLYSQKYKTPAEIKDGETIAIPDDPTNLSRSLKVLASAGLIKLKDDTNQNPTQDDIAENPHNYKIEEIDAAQTSRSLKDVGAAIINTDLAVDAGLSPADDSIFLEPVTDNSKPYFNLIAARKEDANNELYKKVVAAYQTQEIGDYMIQVYKGAQFPVWEGYVKK